jgi:hypothetical protein
MELTNKKQFKFKNKMENEVNSFLMNSKIKGIVSNSI